MPFKDKKECVMEIVRTLTRYKRGAKKAATIRMIRKALS